jgi:hypothetical protein
MRFLLDENVSFRVAGQLKAAGLDAVHVGEVGLTNTDDAQVGQGFGEHVRAEPRVVASRDVEQLLAGVAAAGQDGVDVEEVSGRPPVKQGVHLAASGVVGMKHWADVEQYRSAGSPEHAEVDLARRVAVTSDFHLDQIGSLPQDRHGETFAPVCR